MKKFYLIFYKKSEITYSNPIVKPVGELYLSLLPNILLHSLLVAKIQVCQKPD